MAAPSLKRTNVLAVILSDITTTVRSRRTFNGNPVERRGQVSMFGISTGFDQRAVLVVRGGEVALQTWGLSVLGWTWVQVDDAAAVVRFSGAPIDLPKDGVIFHPPALVGAGMRARALSEMEEDMY